MKEIIVSGKTVIVDDEDFEFVSKKKWHLVSGKSSTHVFEYFKVGRGRPLSRILLNVVSKKLVVDHINGNTFDNRRANLRICTPAENSRNRKVQKNNKVGFKGVFEVRQSGKFQAVIYAGGERHYLGQFDCPFRAARAYDAKAKELHGEFASLNFPPKPA